LERMPTNLWIPHQVVLEFQNNKETVKKEQFNKYINISRDINVVLSETRHNLNKKFYRYKKFQFPNIKQLESKFDSSLGELKAEVDNFITGLGTDAIKNKDMLKNNIIETFVSNLDKDGRIGVRYSVEQLLAIYQEGDARFRYRIPPGYLDMSKDAKDDTGTKKYGDLIVWKQILSHAKSTRKNVLFINGDEKKDWWEVAISGDKEELVGPRTELLNEFEDIVNHNQNFQMITLGQFISHISKLLNIQSVKTLIELNAASNVDRILNDELSSAIEIEVTSFIEMNFAEAGRFAATYRDIDRLEVIFIGNPEVIDVSIEFEDNSVNYYVTFCVEVEARVFTRINKEDYEMGTIELNLDGSLSFSQIVDFDAPENPMKDITQHSIDSLSVLDGSYFDEDDKCVKCGSKSAIYNYNDEGKICENCSHKRGDYDICTRCGRVVPYERMGADGMCLACEKD